MKVTGRGNIDKNLLTILKEEMRFRKGILDGMHISYHRNGNIKRKGSYTEGKLHGIWVGFDETGNKTYEVEYRNDTLIGRYISWYTTGVIRQKGEYQNNQAVGEWTNFDESGMILNKILL